MCLKQVLQADTGGAGCSWLMTVAFCFHSLTDEFHQVQDAAVPSSELVCSLRASLRSPPDVGPWGQGLHIQQALEPPSQEGCWDI